MFPLADSNQATDRPRTSNQDDLLTRCRGGGANRSTATGETCCPELLAVVPESNSSGLHRVMPVSLRDQVADLMTSHFRVPVRQCDG